MYALKCKTFEFTITLSFENLREELKMAWDTLRPVTVGTVRNDDPASFQFFYFYLSSVKKEEEKLITSARERERKKHSNMHMNMMRESSKRKKNSNYIKK